MIDINSRDFIRPVTFTGVLVVFFLVVVIFIAVRSLS